MHLWTIRKQEVATMIWRHWAPTNRRSLCLCSYKNRQTPISGDTWRLVLIYAGQSHRRRGALRWVDDLHQLQTCSELSPFRKLVRICNNMTISGDTDTWSAIASPYNLGDNQMQPSLGVKGKSWQWHHNFNVTRLFYTTQQLNIVRTCPSDSVKGDERPRHTH